MFDKTPVELSKNGKLLVNKFDRFVEKNFTRALALLSYLGPLALGLYYPEFFSKSPIVEFVAMILGFAGSSISWVFAFLFNGVVFGNFDFAKAVFNLHSVPGFKIPVALLFITLPVSCPLTRILYRTASSYLHKKILFFVVLAFSISLIGSNSRYIDALGNQNVYWFSFTIIGIFHYLIFEVCTKPRRRR